jgi:hypothetical protein
MAKKKRRKRPATSATHAAASAKIESASNAARREKKEAARRERERAAKARARRSAGRRALIGGFVGLLVFFAISWFQRAPSAKPLPDTAVNAASAAGCSTLESPTADPTNNHLQPGQTIAYPEQPATSGDHSPQWLDENIRQPETPVDETQAVHTLEHGSVIIYYRPAGEPDGLPNAVRTGLGSITQRNATYVIPYPQLPAGTAVVFTAWNKRITCPATITQAQAEAIANGFVDAYACSSNAPEGKNGAGC